MTSDSFAQSFIRRQVGEYLLLGITGMTAKQRERVEALDVVEPARKGWALEMMHYARLREGRPPHQSSGLMRVVNMHTGEISLVRA